MLFKVEESVFALQIVVFSRNYVTCCLPGSSACQRVIEAAVCVEAVALWKALEQACYSGFDLLSGNHIKNQLKRDPLYALTTQVGPCACQSELNHS